MSQGEINLWRQVNQSLGINGPHRELAADNPLNVDPPETEITVIIPGVDDNRPWQQGECIGCHARIASNRKAIYCPNCGMFVSLT
ncbi:MAG: hypothetical protein KGJ13_07280 [Patescibacteria group bacterium]|nr:hypothetical protein [Patescibacteria group bacterium]